MASPHLSVSSQVTGMTCEKEQLKPQLTGTSEDLFGTIDCPWPTKESEGNPKTSEDYIRELESLFYPSPSRDDPFLVDEFVPESVGRSEEAIRTLESAILPWPSEDPFKAIPIDLLFPRKDNPRPNSEDLLRKFVDLNKPLPIEVPSTSNMPGECYIVKIGSLFYRCRKLRLLPPYKPRPRDESLPPPYHYVREKPYLPVSYTKKESKGKPQIAANQC